MSQGPTSHGTDERQRRAAVPEKLQEKGGLTPGTARQVARETGVPEAEIYGVGSFFHLLADAEHKVRVCTGLACQLGGVLHVLEAARAAGACR